MVHSLFGPKPQAIMYGVSTELHAINERLVRHAVVNKSEVIIRWFHSLRSNSADSKAARKQVKIL